MTKTLGNAGIYTQLPTSHPSLLSFLPLFSSSKVMTVLPNEHIYMCAHVCMCGMLGSQNGEYFFFNGNE
jgi:hypothetical protein